MSACEQNFLGGSVVCGAASQESDGVTGAKDLWVSGFENVPGNEEAGDYYFLEIVTTQGIDTIYGAGYGP